MEYIEKIVNKTNKYLSLEQKVAFISCLLVGIFGHIYTFFNHVFRHDGVLNIYGLGATHISGRWGLDLLYRIRDVFFGNNTIPFVNGMLSILLIAISSIFVIKILNLKNKYLCVLLGISMVSFPVVSAIFSYMYTAPAYFLSLFLNVFAIYILSKNFNIKNAIIALTLLVISLGIYQAFISVSMTLAIIVLVRKIIEEYKDYKTVLIMGFKYLFIFLISIVLYLLLVKFFVSINNIQLTDYKGMNEMGTLEISKIPYAIFKAYESFFFLKWFNINSLWFMRAIMFLLMAISGVLVLSIFKNNIKKMREKMLFVLLIALFPLAVNIVYLFSTSKEYYVSGISCYSYVFSFAFLIYLFEYVNNKKLGYKKIISLSLLLISIINVCYIYINNFSYYKIYAENKQVEAFYNRLLTRIEMLPNYKSNLMVYYIDENNKKINLEGFGSTFVLPNGYSIRSSEIINSYTWRYQMKYYTGVYFEPYKEVDNEMINNLEVINMDVYPNNNSIKIINDVIVVKFGNSLINE